MIDSPVVKLIWVTPDADALLTYMAKVSNPGCQEEPAPHLIRYLMENGHWSPFEMANICFEVNTTRTIGRQFLRHWTMRVQEFSQRYADPTALGDPIFSKARLAHPTNRQDSIPTDEADLIDWWDRAQQRAWDVTTGIYAEARERGIPKEQARNVMCEGLTPTRMYFNAQIRTLLHLCNLRSKKHGAQDEAVAVAQKIEKLIRSHTPDTHEAYVEWSS